MSYDLMVFEEKAAPKDKNSFMDWYKHQTEWTEEHSYDDPAVSSAALRNWFMDIKAAFPPMNGPFALSDDEFDELGDDEVKVTDYSIGRDAIYAAFAWSCAEEAYEMVKQLAKKHRVGFFDASGDGDIFLPDGSEMA
ncbi:hypothetical protein [Paenibacillus sp. GCM10027626]|uniref:hypothetical protein n=1 Tax=Paenibacillus sp. GCM10027626 TaxID=3273411 RepID=UPI003645218D